MLRKFDSRSVRMFRLFRLFRVFKLLKYNKAIDNIVDAFKESKRREKGFGSSGVG